MLLSYPRAALNGQPTIAPAATPSTATGILSIYQPVMAISVVYIQKLLGRKAASIKKKNKNEKMKEDKRLRLASSIKSSPTRQNVNSQSDILGNAFLEIANKGIFLF